jgi:uncharacterized protein with HEPN domain
MNEDDLIRLRHMLDSAREAIVFADGESREALDSDRKLTLALIKSVEIIGEAASKLSQTCRDTNPQIPWSKITGMRNRLIHAYFDINLDLLWETVARDLPVLAQELVKIIPEDSDL